jgi:GTP-binding protein EngB required for normal cell division
MIGPTAETNRLRQYTLDKQEATTAIRSLIKFLEERNRPEALEHAQELLVRLAEDRFNLAVVGQFKRGKSSLMNAIIGRDLLPTGLLPLTSAITTLCYGPQDRVVLRRKGWLIEQEIPLGELAEYVTEHGNPGNEKGLLEARVELPVRFLRRGLHFIDTPGVGSTHRENSLTTYAFLPEADAVIFVTSVEAPLSEAETGFLQDISQYVRKLFVVVNKMDLLAPNERDLVLGYIREGIEKTLGADEVRLFPLSARQGLAAKLGVDSDGASGLPEFEEVLAAFLAEEKERTFLVAILDRARRLLDDESEARDLRAQIELLHAALLEGAPRPPAPKLPAADTRIIEQAVAAQRTEQTNKRATLRSGACPICEGQSQAIFNFFAQWQYTLSQDVAAQHAFATARGFCYVHTWVFAQIASPQGISEGYAPLIDAAADELRAALEQSRQQATEHVGALLPKVETCAACRVLRESEQEQIRQLLSQLARTDEQIIYAHTPGLCLPHLRLALAAAPSREISEMLMRAQVQCLEELSEDMRSYTLKRDALRRGLLNDQEEKAWRRALVQLVGERNLRVV